MTQKFGRNYRLTIDTRDGAEQIIIEPPLTFSMSVKRATMASLNTGIFQITNLSKETYSAIFQDWNLHDVNRKVKVEAGYGSELATIFSGSIWEANTARQGTEIVTTIRSKDGSFESFVDMTFQTLQSGTDIKDVFKTLIGSSNLEYGAVGEFDQTFKRPVVLDGNIWKLIQKYSNEQCFIDLGKVYVLPRGQVVSGGEDIQVIDASTGLLETPRREQQWLILKMLFEPRLNLGRKIQLKSQFLPEYDGEYEIIGVNHEGLISEAECGRLITTLTLNAPFGGIKEVSGG